MSSIPLPASTPRASLTATLPRAWRWLGGLAAVLLCLAVFGLYTVPDFMVMLADQMWSCF